IAGARRPRSGWVLQVAAAAALLVLAVGLGIAVQRARQSVGVTPTATPFASPNINPTPTPTPSGPYPLLPPASLRMINASTGWAAMNLGLAAGSQGVAFYGTVNGGATWTKLSEADTSGSAGHLPLGCSKGVPVFLNASTGWLPGSCSAGGGPFFYVTRDGGRTWHNVA